MIVGRARGLIAAGAIIVLIVDLMLLISGVPAKQGQRRDRTEELDAKRVATSGEVSKLQIEYDKSLVQVNSWFVVLDEVINLGRTVDGVNQSRTRFDTAIELRDEAQKAAANLIPLSTDIIDEAQAGRRDLGELISLISDVEDERFLKSLDRAYELLIRTHEIYGRMNQELQEGFGVYRELFDVSQKFFSERFRTPRETATVYDFRTERLVPRMTQFKNDYNQIRDQALAAAQRTAEAFQRSKDLNEAR